MQKRSSSFFLQMNSTVQWVHHGSPETDCQTVEICVMKVWSGGLRLWQRSFRHASWVWLRVLHQLGEFFSWDQCSWGCRFRWQMEAENAPVNRRLWRILLSFFPASQHLSSVSKWDYGKILMTETVIAPFLTGEAPEVPCGNMWLSAMLVNAQ